MSWHDLIREAREARNLSQSKLAKAIGVSQAIIGKIETKQVESTKALEALIAYLSLDRSAFPAEAFGQIVHGQGELRGIDAQSVATEPLPEFARDPAYWAAAAGLVGDVPLYASAEGGAGSLIIERDPIGAEKRPPELQGVKAGYAIYLVGESMSPEFEPGDTLFINPRLPIIPNSPCVFYSSKNDEPIATVKRYLKDTGEDWLVRQHNPPRDLDLDKAEWTVRHRIILRKPR